MSKVYDTIFLFLIIFGSSSIANANSSLEVNFRGILMSTTCQVSSDSLNKEVILNNLRWQSLNENGKSAIKNFFINIEKCSDSDLTKTINLTWQSQNTTLIDGESYIVTDGGTNALLGITDENEQVIEFNKPIYAGKVKVVDDTQQIKFGVFVRKPNDRNINIGDFVSIATFTVEYE